MAKLMLALEHEGQTIKEYSTVGDLNVLDNAFKQAVIESFDLSIRQAMEKAKNEPEEVVKPKEVEEVKENLFEEIEEPEEPEEPEETEDTSDELSLNLKLRNQYVLRRHENHRALVAFKCPDCGRVHIGVHIVGDTIKCHYCHSDILVPDNLIFTEFKCPNCNNRAYMYTQPEINSIPCKNCSSPIDFKFVDKLGFKKSLNLL